MAHERTYARLREILATGICPKCHEKKNTIDIQYSYRVYAGIMCRECAIHGYRDGCGHRPEGQGHPQELIDDGENYFEED